MSNGVMLILRGIRNQLHEEPAKQYALLQNFTPEVLDVSGETGPGSPQVRAALKRIREGGVVALYGFSGGGYNVVHIWRALTQDEKNEMELLVVLGSPGVEVSSVPEALVVIFDDPHTAHMEQPAKFLEVSVARHA